MKSGFQRVSRNCEIMYMTDLLRRKQTTITAQDFYGIMSKEQELFAYVAICFNQTSSKDEIHTWKMAKKGLYLGVSVVVITLLLTKHLPHICNDAKNTRAILPKWNKHHITFCAFSQYGRKFFDNILYSRFECWSDAYQSWDFEKLWEGQSQPLFLR